jgi:hypothetical protein
MRFKVNASWQVNPPRCRSQAAQKRAVTAPLENSLTVAPTTAASAASLRRCSKRNAENEPAGATVIERRESD